MKILKKIIRYNILFCLIGCLLFCSISNVRVYADDRDSKFMKTTGVNKKNMEKAKVWVAALQSEHYSDAACAAIIGNAISESHCNPLADEKGVNGGLFGFTPMTNFSNSKFNKNCKHGKGTAGGQSICSEGSCQIAYMLSCLKGDISSCSGRLTKYNKFMKEHGTEVSKLNYSSYAQSVGWKTNDVAQSVPEISTLEEFKKIKDPVGGALIFTICFEKCAGTFIPCGLEGKSLSNFNDVCGGYSQTWGDFFLKEFSQSTGRAANAAAAYEWISGQQFKASGNGGTGISESAAQDMGKTLVQNGVWTEQQYSNFCQLVEMDVDKAFLEQANRDNLTSDELGSLSNWNANIGDDSLLSKLIIFLRRLVALVGILITLWGILFYIAFWFDRLNNIWEFRITKILSFNKLEASFTDNPEESTYHTTAKTEAAKLIIHRQCIKIVLIAEFAGAILISGKYYDIIRTLVNFIRHFFE